MASNNVLAEAWWARQGGDAGELAELFHSLAERQRVPEEQLMDWVLQIARAVACWLSRAWRIPIDALDYESVAGIAVVTACYRLGSIRKPDCWFRGTIRHLLLREIRNQQRACTLFALPLEALDARIVAQERRDILVSDRYRSPRAKRIRQAVSMLSPKLREVITEYYLHDRPKSEVLRRLKIGDAVFRQRVHRAKLRLRPLLLNNACPASLIT